MEPLTHPCPRTNYNGAACQQAYRTAIELRHHISATHQLNVCPICNRSFNRASVRLWSLYIFQYVKCHIRAIHQGIRDFKCPFCPLRFSTTSNVADHLNRHLGYRPYSCLCQKGFFRKNQLTKHAT
ncbi:hypothetical protein FGO68_gene10560 [Halteria grandinella]|uniref:C2H2-type domain-containing protein n=1 Tax=Halteria grandinella TaxID=5974 RepID=A0A8J8T098_HALGN|nr:hypothetical protein FGO68_gene10560 [Halteria grandinella]